MTHTKLLLLGVPRSGTTLLTGMIGAHTDIAMLNEDMSFAMRLLVGKKVVGNKLCIPNQINFESSVFTRLARRYGYCFYRDCSVRSLNEYLSDDNLKLVVILRDPRASIASMMKHGNNSFREAGKRWEQGTEIAYRLYDQEKERTLLLSFERLVEAPERILRSICDFLLLDFDSSMMEGWKSTPYSNRGGIQREKAQAGREANLPGNPQEEFMEAYEMYTSLRGMCVGHGEPAA